MRMARLDHKRRGHVKSWVRTREASLPTLMRIQIVGLRYRCRACGENLSTPDDNSAFWIWEKRVNFHFSVCPKLEPAARETAKCLNDLMEPLYIWA